MVQRRLRGPEIEWVASEYQSGRTLIELARELRVHQRTIAAHLDARGVERRVNRRKLCDDDVTAAADRYREGDSLATIGAAFNVDAATIRREFHRAGVPIRARPGWN